MTKAVAEFRENYRATEISKYYSGIGHLLFTSSVGIGVIAFCIYQLQHPSWMEYLIIPASFLIGNMGEYFGHKGPLHHKTRFGGLVFKRHTLQHHNYFTEEDMQCSDKTDYKMILFPPVLILFFLGLMATPIGLLFYTLISHNVGYLFVATVVGYFINYEWLHLMYHQPEDSWVFKIPGLKSLKLHHTNHHNRSIMSTHNFNITYPIGDTLFGTTWKKK